MFVRVRTPTNSRSRPRCRLLRNSKCNLESKAGPTLAISSTAFQNTGPAGTLASKHDSTETLPASQAWLVSLPSGVSRLSLSVANAFLAAVAPISGRGKVNVFAYQVAEVS